MGFIFQRRIKLGGGFGFNLSKSGASPSVKTKYGTIGAKGYSIRTGIPGFYWRSRWGSKNSGITALILLVLWLGYVTIAFLIKAIIFVIPLVFQVLYWIVMTLYDFIKYLFKPSDNLVLEKKGGNLKWDWINEKFEVEDGKVISKNDKINIDDFDPLFREAAITVVQSKLAHVSLLKRRLNIDDKRAEKLIEELEKSGIIAPYEGNKSRSVLIKNINDLYDFLDYYATSNSQNQDKKSDSNSYTSHSFKLDYPTYQLIDEYATSLYDISQKLIKDQLFIQLINKNFSDQEQNTPELIQGLILQDVAKVFKLTTNTNGIDLESKEMFGFSLICLRLFNAELIKDYDTLSHIFNSQDKEAKDAYYDSCISFLKFADPKSIQGNIKDSQGQTIVKFNTPLSIPYLLKASGHPLFEEYATSLYRFASLIVKIDGIVTKKEENALKKIWEISHNPIPKHIEEQYLNRKELENNSFKTSTEKNLESLEDILKELNELVGLTRVKDEVKTLVNFVKVQKEREAKGLKGSNVSYHCIFVGSPGTGKTTVARIIAKIYKHLNVVTKGHLIETDRSGLIAEYMGQTATKVDRVISSSIGGVLFIDEAYAISNNSKEDYGKEAVATLIKRMEDNRDDLVVIFAGYLKEMQEFIETNPGFKSRVNRYIHFDDYNPTELTEIFESLCDKNDYKLTKEAKSKLLFYFEDRCQNKDKSFGNGRLARNIYESTIENHANRISNEPRLSKKILTTIEVVDIPNL